MKVANAIFTKFEPLKSFLDEYKDYNVLTSKLDNIEQINSVIC